MFFDRQAVIDAVGRANVKVLSRAGAFIQRRGEVVDPQAEAGVAAGRAAQFPRRHAAGT